MTSTNKRFAARLALLTLPGVLLVGSYFVLDPFCVLFHRHFGDYFDEQPVELTRDFVSTEMYLEHEGTEHYDSFIFGSSRSGPFQCAHWLEIAGPGRCFHYQAGSENLYGVYLKLKFLDERGVSVKNALFEFDSDSLGDVRARTDHLHRIHWKVSGESWLSFQTVFFRSYFIDFFPFKYAAWKLEGRVRPWARQMLAMEQGWIRIDPLTNDYFYKGEERELARDEEAFYRERATVFPTPASAPTPSRRVIGEAQRSLLWAIRWYFDKHQTRYRFVLPPRYDRVPFNPDDVKELHEIFGENVVDFTANAEMAGDMHHFYDATHVRPFIADQIMRQLYLPAPPESQEAPRGQ